MLTGAHGPGCPQRHTFILPEQTGPPASPDAVATNGAYMTNLKTSATIGLILTGLLSACSQNDAGTLPASAAGPQYDRVLTLKLRGGETATSLQAQYGGRVLAFKPLSGFALVATSRPASSFSTLSVGSASEPNRSQVHASAGTMIWMKAGTMIWMKAGTLIWMKAGTMIWMKGSYQPVPENTDNWTSIGLDAAQTRLTHLGAGVKVAVIDTGADLNLSVLRGSLAPGSEWRDYVGNDALPDEEGQPGEGGYGHGTGIATAILQISPQVSILPMRVLGADGSGDVDHTAQAIIDAADDGARVINLSLGMPESSPALETAIRYAESQGSLVVTASGNDGQGAMDFPARGATQDPLRLAVGSVDASGTISAFSNTGAGLSVYAPGEWVYGPAPQEMMAAWSGTSESAGVVSAAAALGLGEGVPASSVRAALLSTAAPVLSDSGTVVPGPGRLDLDAFSRALLP